MISITEPHGSPPEPTAYFIDESGHSGDLAATRALDFADQPVFALACIGVADARALGAEMERLRGVHGCGPGELKSAMARLPRFVTDLAAYLKARDCPVFIELVDKRFFIAAHVVTYLLCGGLGLGQVPEPVRNAVAEFLTDEPADALLLGYLAACREPSLPAIRVLLDELWAWFDASDGDIARVGQFLTMEARDRACRADADTRAFLPLPDRTESDRMVWMLPNLTSLAHMYGRINLSRAGGLEGVSLVHDEQLQYGRVLADTKAAMDDLARQGPVMHLPFADYDVSGAAALCFTASTNDLCLQASDLLAGCAMRFARDAADKRRRLDPSLREAFFALLRLTDASRGHGVNLVFTYAALGRMGIPVHRAF
ncbi:hypothetical protein ATE68_00065 [Sphingopyxis sp. H038]|nr:MULTISPECIES: DUF3800 domain-containing protein [unclassified Sphingopyxis]KTE22369.1 hypothetical protein ATE75_20505 [Sphingopyxis sp. H080]KTE61733.1 hypothetical protein ATE74_21035 [Sphingopyxis sp. H085]KTE04103.1 hypothetical protein ATE78_00065 [Sphingopyxis sp. H012]KTE06051.1 hypothetical protein ATE70_23135 [Sphingopyxis sp. H053]KTE15618.1 hypothetical protein ATE76_02245 [Sphingopyxis sp. H093]